MNVASLKGILHLYEHPNLFLESGKSVCVCVCVQSLIYLTPLCHKAPLLSKNKRLTQSHIHSPAARNILYILTREPNVDSSTAENSPQQMLRFSLFEQRLIKTTGTRCFRKCLSLLNYSVCEVLVY